MSNFGGSGKVVKVSGCIDVHLLTSNGLQGLHFHGNLRVTPSMHHEKPQEKTSSYQRIIKGSWWVIIAS